jgi:hypothetical protein
MALPIVRIKHDDPALRSPFSGKRVETDLGGHPKPATDGRLKTGHFE